MSILESIKEVEAKAEFKKKEALEKARIIVEEAKKEAENEAKRIIEEAKKEAKQINKNTLKQIDENKKNIMDKYQAHSQKLINKVNNKLNTAVDFILGKVIRP